jgi:hypothetical protein
MISPTPALSLEGKIDFHSERAMAELDQALQAGSVLAARAHFNLSALHLERMRGLRGETPEAPLS